jgi:hypothetical protein
VCVCVYVCACRWVGGGVCGGEKIVTLKQTKEESHSRTARKVEEQERSSKARQSMESRIATCHVRSQGDSDAYCLARNAINKGVQ